MNIEELIILYRKHIQPTIHDLKDIPLSIADHRIHDAISQTIAAVSDHAQQLPDPAQQTALGSYAKILMHLRGGIALAESSEVEESKVAGMAAKYYLERYPIADTGEVVNTLYGVLNFLADQLIQENSLSAQDLEIRTSEFVGACRLFLKILNCDTGVADSTDMSLEHSLDDSVSKRRDSIVKKAKRDIGPYRALTLRLRHGHCHDHGIGF